jgi:hypothetical protein
MKNWLVKITLICDLGLLFATNNIGLASSSKLLKLSKACRAKQNF